jgi:hypothetical protein
MCATDDACLIPKEIISTRDRFGYPQRTTDDCEIRPRKDKRGVDLISECAAIRSPFGHAEPNAVSNAIGYAKFRSRSHDAVIRVYDPAGNVIKTHEHAGDFREWVSDYPLFYTASVAARRRLQTLWPVSFACATRFRYFNFTVKTRKPGRPGRPRIRTAAYWREYYTRKQREWRAAHPRTRTGRKQRNKKPPHGEA